MFEEIIFHSTFIPKLNRHSILKNLSETKRFIDSKGIFGCSVVHNDEALHLFQGDKASISELRSMMKSKFIEFHIQEISSETIDKKEFQDWAICCDICDTAAIMFPNNVVNQNEFESNYLAERNRKTVFPHMAKDILNTPKAAFSMA